MCKWIVSLIAVCLVVIPGVSAAVAEPTPQIQAFLDVFNACCRDKDIDGLTALAHPDVDPNALKKNMEEVRKELEHLSLHAEYLDHVLREGDTVVRALIAEEGQDGKVVKRLHLFMLRPHDGRLLIERGVEGPDVNDFDLKTGVYTSRKGKFTLTAPPGWNPIKASGMLAALPDSIVLLAPDMKSSAFMGFIQLPMKLADDATAAAETAARTDVAMEKRMTKEHQILKRGPVRMAGREGYRVVARFNAEGQRQRMRVYFVEHPMVYFFLCDAVGPERFDELLPQFNGIVESFKALPIEPGMTRQDAIAAEQATGAVTGSVYTSEEYNCFIAAPEGWEIRTSPNPAHLAEMQFTEGKSIARLIAVKGLPESAKLDEVFAQRREAVRQLVQDFVEVSRRNTTLAGLPAIESVQTFRLDEFGAFRVKQVTAIRDGTYYLVLCQCIEPDDYQALEPDFDRIIASFGFIQ